MSGPKSYSITVLDSHLAELFSCQAEIEQLYERLSRCRLSDPARGIGFDCSRECAQLRNEVHEATAPFSIDQAAAQVSAEQLATHRETIAAKLRGVSALKKRLIDTRERFDRRQRDYASFVALETHRASALAAFETYKNELIAYLEENLGHNASEADRQSLQAIDTVTCALPPMPFAFGFSARAKDATREMEAEIRRCETAIGTIRNELAARVSPPDSSPPTTLRPLPETIRDRIEAIGDMVRRIPEPTLRDRYLAELKELSTHPSRRDEHFYYDELLGKAADAEQTPRFREEVRAALERVEQTAILPALREELERVAREAVSLLTATSIKAKHHAAFIEQCEELLCKNEQAHRAQLARKRESDYTVAHLARGLHSLGYKTADDLTVIDLERGADALFTIPDQNNYLFLRVKADGRIEYQFVIPEERRALSVEQQQHKLEQMQTTCTQFKAVLARLALMGVRVDIDTERPVESRYLLQVPAKYAERVAAKRHRHAREGNRAQRYLDT